MIIKFFYDYRSRVFIDLKKKFYFTMFFQVLGEVVQNRSNKKSILRKKKAKKKMFFEMLTDYLYIFMCFHWLVQFVDNAWLLAIIPLTPKNLSIRAYRLSLIGTTCSSLFSLYVKPRAWNLQAVQLWLQSLLATKDFIYFIYCLTFVSSNLNMKFALIPVLCRSLEHVAKFLRRNFSHSSLYRKYLDEACLWVESNTTTLGILTSHEEIGVGFIFIISLFSWQRHIIQIFMYWQVCFIYFCVWNHSVGWWWRWCRRLGN
ncbi:hypothetical protein MKX03_022958 [Papaver bracteatum]|nr:hypothetical protein MKX03_022958 [Papaver bracteatum]